MKFQKVYVEKFSDAYFMYKKRCFNSGSTNRILGFEAKYNTVKNMQKKAV